jgi:hypothetical protein
LWRSWLCTANRLLGLGAPDSVRCARLTSVNWLLSGLRRRCTTINHRTVRWCIGLSGEPTVGPANGRPRNPRATRGRANGQKGAPDCPVCTGQCPVRQADVCQRAALGTSTTVYDYKSPDCPVVHRTVR